MILAPVRLLTTLLSLSILLGAAWLLASWWEGEWVRAAGGALERQRADWRLWAGLGLLAWSFLGRFIVPFLAARPDHRPIRRKRARGHILPGPDGADLYVESHGPDGAPPIVFTHGWAMDCSFWRYAKEDLAGRFRLVFWDLPGLGRSKLGRDRAVSLEAMAAALAAVLEAGAGRRAVLVGHSIGGMVIQTLARDRPQAFERVAGVVLLNTTYVNPLRTMVFSRLLLALQKPLLEPMEKLSAALQPLVWLAKWQSWMSGAAHLMIRFGFGRWATRSQLRHVTLLSTRAAPAVEARGNLAMMNWDADGALARLAVPVLVVGGEGDIVTRPDAGEAMAALARRGEFDLVPGVNHMGPLEQAEIYNGLIADFALSVQSARPADGPRRPQTMYAPGDGPNPAPRAGGVHTTR